MAKKSNYEILLKKWSKRHNKARKELLEKHKEAVDWLVDKVPAKDKLASGAVGALMLTSVIPQSTALVAIAQSNKPAVEQPKIDKKTAQLDLFKNSLLPEVRPLTPEEESTMSAKLSEIYGFKLSAELHEKRLNRSYGLIGAEQHLFRYPGDNLQNHLENADEQAMFGPSGIAPGLGAWGYFAKSQTDFDQNPKAKAREKWYIAVPTFLSPGFNQNVKEHYEWFKYRKMLLINTKTGESVVCDIADAGPAEWTGKHLGGSPEVMHYLGLGKGPRKGPVLYFFIDDPNDKIPLGPVNL